MTGLSRRTFLAGSATALGVLGGCLGSDDREAWRVDVQTAGGIAAASGTAYLGTLEGVYAIDVASGDVDWRYRETYEEINQPPTVVGELVYVGLNGGGGVHAIESGARDWVFDDAVNNASRPVVAGETILVTAGGYLYAIDRVEGTERRRLELEDHRPITPTLVGDTLFLVTDGELWAIDRSTFDRRWTHPVHSDAVAAGDRRLYVSSEATGGLAALDPADGSVLWSSDADPTSKPVLAPERVYASSRTSGGIVAYSRDGREQWTSEHGRRVSVPTPGTDAVYAVDFEYRKLFATAVDDGATEWSVEFDDHPRYRPTNAREHVLVPTTGAVVAVEK